MTKGPTGTGAAAATAVRSNRESSARRLVKRRRHALQESFDTLSGTLDILRAQPHEQRLVHVHERLQAFALFRQPAQRNAPTDIPQQRIPDTQESPVAATFDQPAVKTQGIINVVFRVVHFDG